MKPNVLYFAELPKGLRLSEEHVRQLTEWFGPNPDDWKGHRLRLSRKPVTDADGKVIGETIGIERLPE